jgi:hypothetical protein
MSELVDLIEAGLKVGDEVIRIDSGDHLTITKINSSPAYPVFIGDDSYTKYGKRMLADDFPALKFIKPEESIATKEDSTKGAIKSDGGSSSYYVNKLPEWLLAKIAESGSLEVEDIIEVVLNNDFNLGTAFKSLARSASIQRGEGKAGNSLEYEANKVVYYGEKIKQISKRESE